MSGRRPRLKLVPVHDSPDRARSAIQLYDGTNILGRDLLVSHGVPDSLKMYLSRQHVEVVVDGEKPAVHVRALTRFQESVRLNEQPLGKTPKNAAIGDVLTLLGLQESKVAYQITRYCFHSEEESGVISGANSPASSATTRHSSPPDSATVGRHSLSADGLLKDHTPLLNASSISELQDWVLGMGQGPVPASPQQGQHAQRMRQQLLDFLRHHSEACRQPQLPPRRTGSQRILEPLEQPRDHESEETAEPVVSMQPVAHQDRHGSASEQRNSPRDSEPPEKSQPQPRQALPELEDELTCIICSDLIVRASVLVCGHSFCRGCIRDWMNTRAECPVCSKSISHPIAKCLTLDTSIEMLAANQLLAAESCAIWKKRTEEESAKVERSPPPRKRKRSAAGSATTTTSSSSLAQSSRPRSSSTLPSSSSAPFSSSSLSSLADTGLFVSANLAAFLGTTNSSSAPQAPPRRRQRIGGPPNSSGPRRSRVGGTVRQPASTAAIPHHRRGGAPQPNGATVAAREPEVIDLS